MFKAAGIRGGAIIKIKKSSAILKIPTNKIKIPVKKFKFFADNLILLVGILAASQIDIIEANGYSKHFNQTPRKVEVVRFVDPYKEVLTRYYSSPENALLETETLQKLGEEIQEQTGLKNSKVSRVLKAKRKRVKTFSELKKEFESENNKNFHEEENIHENTLKDRLRIKIN